MKLAEWIQKLEKIGEGDIPIVVLNGKPLRGVIDADTKEGWAIVPDLSGEIIENLEQEDMKEKLGKPGVSVASPATIERKKLEGKVEFAAFRPKKQE